MPCHDSRLTRSSSAVTPFKAPSLPGPSITGHQNASQSVAGLIAVLSLLESSVKPNGESGTDGAHVHHDFPCRMQQARGSGNIQQEHLICRLCRWVYCRKVMPEGLRNNSQWLVHCQFFPAWRRLLIPTSSSRGSVCSFMLGAVVWGTLPSSTPSWLGHMSSPQHLQAIISS